MENWKPVKDFPRYEVSSQGRVRSVTTSDRGHKPKILKLRLQMNGYLRCNLGRNGEVFTMLVHRLVAEAFLPPDAKRPTVNHRDGKKQRNCVENLEWSTLAENNRHSAHKRFAATNPRRAMKLTAEQIPAIKAAHASGERSGVIAGRFGVSPAMIRNIVFGRAWIMPKSPYTLADRR